MNREPMKPVNDIEQKLTEYFEQRKKALKAPGDLWAKIENRLEAPLERKSFLAGLSTLFARRPRLFNALASILALVLVAAAGVWVGRELGGGRITSLSPAVVTSPAPAPLIGLAPSVPDAGEGGIASPAAPAPSRLEKQAVAPGGEGLPGPSLTGATPAGTPGLPAPPSAGALLPAPEATPAPRPAAAGAGAAAPGGVLDTARRQIVSTASVSIEVKAVGSAIDRLQAIAGSLGGLVEQLSRSGSGEQEQAAVTLRLPRDQFPAALSALEPLGKIQSQTLQSEDISQRFIDMEARLKSLQREEQSLLTLLGRTQNVSEILTIEREISRIRGEIGGAQGQINLLKRRVDLASITVNLFTTA